MAGQKRVFIQDGDPNGIIVDGGLNDREVARQLAITTGTPWLTQATVCQRANGDVEFKRPPAGSKG